MDAFQTIRALKLHLPAILHDRPVMLAYVYGSVADGCPTTLSDVDIGLVLEPECGLNPHQRFMTELDIEAELEIHGGITNADVRSIQCRTGRSSGQGVDG